MHRSSMHLQATFSVLLLLCVGAHAHLELYRNISIPPNYHYQSSAILVPQNHSLIGAEQAYVALNVSISWSVSASNRSTTDAAPLSFPRGSIYAIIYSSTHQAAVEHNFAFMKSRGGCPELNAPPYPLFPLPLADDLVVARFPFGEEQIGNRISLNSISIGRLRKRLPVGYRSQWSISLFHCEERVSSPDSIVAHMRPYKVFVTGSAEWVNPFGYASYDEFAPQIFIFGVFASLALLAFAVWILLMIRYRVDLHMYHYIIAALFVIDFAAILSVLVERQSHNATGMFNNSYSVLAIVMYSLMESSFKLFMVFLATGFQIVSHTIGKTRRFVVVAVCLAYFGSSVSSSILRMSNRLHGYAGSGSFGDFGSSSTDDEEVAQLIYLLVTIPVLILEAVFWGWSFIGLEKTIAGLSSPRLALDAAMNNRDTARKKAKLEAFLRYRRIMLVFVVLAFLFGMGKLTLILTRLQHALSSAWWIWDMFDCGFAWLFVAVTGFVVIRPSRENSLMQHELQDQDQLAPAEENPEDDVQLQLIPIASLDNP